ncbi:pilus assembly protein TadG-related protein [Parvularcula sp. LCG005]|uniref:pilus assembly protein TadG-related protein n=1 Tax=Parvularcula sp. LCG005 TaxID=3078805 RepID=UPI0029432D94|nr:pilus assembly protein TadG-related protein [Parvularcula sp. LCG005]WOI54043.1 pilus assembly protein TadG-related protein [Parvularcula sp. LCG005]
MLFALILPCLLMVAALSTEAGFWFSEKKQVQMAADAAAYSAVAAYKQTSDVTAAKAIGVAQAQASGYTGDASGITITIPASDPSLGADSAMVVISQEVPIQLSRVFTTDTTMTVRARSWAFAPPGAATASLGPCMLALNTSSQRAIVYAAGVQMSATSCDIATNSTANDAVWLEGTTHLDVDCVATPGTIGTNGGASYTMNDCSSPKNEVSADYFAGSPFWGDPDVPDTGTCEDASISQGRYGPGMPGGSVLRPGKYCKQVEIAGATTFEPGVYYFTNGFRATNGGAINGAGVTLMFDPSRTLDVAQSVTFDLTAPTTGPTAGMALMGDPSKTSGTVRIIGALGNVEGAIYFPHQMVQMENGPSASLNRCTRIIADKLDIRGGGVIDIDCSGGGGSGGSSSTSGTFVQLTKGTP